MKCKQLLVIAFLLPILSYSQINGLSDVALSINAGVNYSKIKDANIDFRSGARPYIGLSAVFPIANRFNIKGAANYSVMSSNSLSPNFKIENQYIDLTLSPSVEIFQNFYLKAGISYSALLAANSIVRNGDKWNGVERIPATGYGSEINFLTGIEFKIQDNMNLELNYIIPGGKMNTSNFQFGINIALNHRTPPEISYKKKRKAAAERQIVELKQNVLLVRLKTSENTISALRKIGMDEKPKRLGVIKNMRTKA